MIGRFESIGSRDALEQLRRRTLMSNAWYGEPSVPKFAVESLEDLMARTSEIRRHLAGNVAVKISMPSTLSSADFLEWAGLWGYPILENSPKEYVDLAYVLNIKQNRRSTELNDFQPFAENFLTFHVEQAYLPLASQPALIILSCVIPPPVDSGGQTVIAPFSSVISRLSEESISILQNCRLNKEGAPPFLSLAGGSTVFSFRDPGNETIEWRMEDPLLSKKEESDINRAIADLIGALYYPPSIHGIHWASGDIWMINNRECFHGKTYCSAEHMSLELGAARWLRRVRIRDQVE